MNRDKSSTEEIRGFGAVNYEENQPVTPFENLPCRDKNSKAALEELRRCLKVPPAPVPEDALHLLHDAASQDTGGSQACRYFLFWLAGQDDPTGYQGSGGFELRRLDGQLRQAAIQVLTWWSGPTKCDQPLYQVLTALRSRYSEGDDALPGPDQSRLGYGNE